MNRTRSGTSHLDVLGRRIDKEMILYLGGIHASSDPLVIRTLLGSCIGVCLYDSVRRVGGMNHFMLPNGTARPDERARFGVHAMDLLICAIQKAGADRRRVVAKVFGGAHVLSMAETPSSVPSQNIRFIREFLSAESIPMAAEDLGGHRPRVVYFNTGTGQAIVRTLAGEQAWRRVLEREANGQVGAAQYGGITLFENVSDPNAESKRGNGGPE